MTSSPPEVTSLTCGRWFYITTTDTHLEGEINVEKPLTLHRCTPVGFEPVPPVAMTSLPPLPFSLGALFAIFRILSTLTN